MKMYLPILFALLSGRTVNAQCTAAGTNTATQSGNNTTIGTLAWTNTGNTQSVDGSYATAGVLVNVGIFPVTTTTNYLTLNNFGFSIPAANSICGVGLSVTRAYNALLSINGYAIDNVVQLANISGGAVTLLGTNQKAGGSWPYGTPTAQSYGGSGNTMGSLSLTPATVNATTFGAVISADVVASVTGLGIAVSAQIDQVTMTVYNTPPLLLAANLENFTVAGSSGGNRIDWQAGADTKAGQFILQRSADGLHWSDLATIMATAGTGTYDYTDATPLAGINYYRLEVHNTSGSTDYSVTAALATKTVQPTRLYPNPFHDMITITTSDPFTRLDIRDIAGRTLLVRQYPGGVNSAQVPTDGLPQGVYFVTLNGKIYKLIKTQ